MPTAYLHPETDINRHQDPDSLKVLKGYTFLTGDGMIFRYRNIDLFIHVSLADNEVDGSVSYRIYKGGTHGPEAASQYTYNGLLWFWND